MVNTKKKLPSRIKYDNSHPVVSCRVSRDIYNKLVEAWNKDGKSSADILKVGLGVQEASSSQSWQRGHKAGYAKGRAEALRHIALGKCSVCDEPIFFDLTDDKDSAEVIECISEHLVHDACM